MVNQRTTENSVKMVHNLPFDVVAVPQSNISQVLDTDTGTAPKPVNIKIRVRNKEEKIGEHGVISVPKLSTSGPKKIRLVSSDQTIISFDLFMESENVKKVPKKPHYKFLQLFTPSGCFNNQNDDDVYPYVPSSSNETYRARSASNINDLPADKMYEEQFALKKNQPPIINTSTTLKTHSFLGKCKPGGCLDPPFNEDKYIYKPKPKMLTFEKQIIKNHRLVDEKKFNDLPNRDKDKSDNILPCALSKNSIEETYSHSLITYPSALSSCEIRGQEETQNKKSKIKPSVENKVRLSTNEFSNTYFMPPRKHKNEINETQIIKSDSYDSLENDLETQRESIFLSPTCELINQSAEPKILSNNESDKSVVSDKSDSNRLKVNNITIFSVLSSSNIKKAVTTQNCSSYDVFFSNVNIINDKIKINSSTNSMTEIIEQKEAENQVRQVDTDINVFETNRHSSSSIPKNIVTSEDESSINIVTNSKNYQSFKDKMNSNETLNQLLTPRIPDELNENRIKCDYNKPVCKDPTVTDNLSDNLRQVPSIGNDQECPKNDKSLQSKKEPDHSQLPFTVLHKDQKDSHLNKPLQDVIMTNEGNNDSNNYITDLFISDDSNKFEDKYNDGDISIAILNKGDDKQVVHPKSTRLSTEALTKALLNEETNLSYKETNMISADLRMGSNIRSGITNGKIPTSTLQEKINSTLQTPEIDTNIISADLKMGSNNGNVDFNKETPKPILSEKTSLTFQYQETDSSKNTSLKSGSTILSYNTDSNGKRSISTLQEKFRLKSQTSEINTNIIIADLKNNSSDIIPGNIDTIEETSKPKFQEKTSLTLQIQETYTSMNTSDLKSGSNVISDNTDFNRITLTPSLQQEISSTSQITEKNTSNIISNNIDSKKETPESILQEKVSFTLQKLEKDTIIITNTDLNIDSSILLDNNKEATTSSLDETINSTLQIHKNDIFNDYSLNESDRVASRSEYLKIHKTGDVVLDLHNMNDTVQVESLENIRFDVHHNLSKDIEPVDKDTLETIPQIKLNEKSYVYNSQNTMVINNKKIEDHNENLSEGYSAFNRKSWKSNIAEELSGNVNEVLINSNKNNLKKPGKESILQNNSLIEIDLGFHTFENDHNKTIIKTFDTSKNLQMDPQNKLTIIKSIIRKNDSEIRIPVNPEMDLIFQVKESFDKDSKIDMTDNKKESTNGSTKTKDLLLQEFLETVYKNLVPVENVIRNLKEEADGLTQQQVLFRELLNTLKSKSVRRANTSNKCSCNNHSM